MIDRWTGPVRFQFMGDKYAASTLQNVARKELGVLRNLMGFQNLQQDQRTVHLSNGIVVNVQIVFGQARANIFVPVHIHEPEIYVPPTLPTMYVPEVYDVDVAQEPEAILEGHLILDDTRVGRILYVGPGICTMTTYPAFESDWLDFRPYSLVDLSGVIEGLTGCSSPSYGMRSQKGSTESLLKKESSFCFDGMIVGEGHPGYPSEVHGQDPFQVSASDKCFGALRPSAGCTIISYENNFHNESVFHSYCVFSDGIDGTILNFENIYQEDGNTAERSGDNVHAIFIVGDLIHVVVSSFSGSVFREFVDPEDAYNTREHATGSMTGQVKITTYNASGSLVNTELLYDFTASVDFLWSRYNYRPPWPKHDIQTTPFGYFDIVGPFWFRKRVSFPTPPRKLRAGGGGALLELKLFNKNGFVAKGGCYNKDLFKDGSGTTTTTVECVSLAFIKFTGEIVTLIEATKTEPSDSTVEEYSPSETRFFSCARTHTSSRKASISSKYLAWMYDSITKKSEEEAFIFDLNTGSKLDVTSFNKLRRISRVAFFTEVALLVIFEWESDIASGSRFSIMNAEDGTLVSDGEGETDWEYDATIFGTNYRGFLDFTEPPRP